MNTEPDSLEDLLEGETTAEVAHEQPPPEAQTGDTGTAPPADATPQQTKSDDGPLVPRKALEDERKKRQEIERKFAELGQQRQAPQVQQPQQQFPAEAPDPFIDPQGYAQWVTVQAVQHANQQAEFMMLNREVNRSERRARKAHGDEAVDQAIEAAWRAGVARDFVNDDDPYDALIKWHSDYQVASDPASHRERIRAEIMAEMGLSPKPGQAPTAKPRAPVPKSLASTTSAQPRDTRGRFSDEPTPLEDLIP